MSEIIYDEDFYDLANEIDSNKQIYLVLIIYDIVNNKDRLRVSKILEGYGERVQRSSFECFLNKKKMMKLESELFNAIDHTVDSVRIYKLSGSATVKTYGIKTEISGEDFIIY